MNCLECRELIAAWLDGLLDEPAKAAFESHLASCAACRAEADGAARVYSRLSAAGAVGRSVRARVMETISKRASRPRRMDMIRRHMRGFIAAATAAAVVLVGMFLWMTGGVKPPMSAYAQLAEAVKNSQAAEWVHYRSDRMVNGQAVEGWESFRPRRTAEKWGIRLSYCDGAQGKRYVYYAGSRTITVDDVSQADASRSSDTPDYFTSFTEWFDKRMKQGTEVAKSQRTVDGKVYDVYTVTLGTARMLTAVDPTVRRVVWQEFLTTDGKASEHTSFDYPATGPQDIYALGAPKDAEVVSGTQAKLRSVRDRVEAAQKAFSGRYFAILCSAGRNPDVRVVHIVYRKGELYRVERYLCPTESLPDGASADTAGLEASLRALYPDTVYIRAANPAMQRAAQPGGTMITLGKDGRIEKKVPCSGTSDIETLEGHAWPVLTMINPDVPGMLPLPARSGQFGVLDGIGFYYPHHSSRAKETMPLMFAWFLNPERDYMLEQYVEVLYSQDVSAADAQADIAAPDTAKPTVRSVRESRISEYAQTPEGRWYPKTTVTTTYYKEMPAAIATTTILLDTTRDIPDDLFDIAKFEAEHKPAGK